MKYSLISSSAAVVLSLLPAESNAARVVAIAKYICPTDLVFKSVNGKVVPDLGSLNKGSAAAGDIRGVHPVIVTGAASGAKAGDSLGQVISSADPACSFVASDPGPGVRFRCAYSSGVTLSQFIATRDLPSRCEIPADHIRLAVKDVGALAPSSAVRGRANRPR